MKRVEHLLSCLAEECAEVAQRASKAMRFGLLEVQKGQTLNNAERIVDELRDLIAVAAILEREGAIPDFVPDNDGILAKQAKIERYFAISREQGTLSEEPRP